MPTIEHIEINRDGAQATINLGCLPILATRNLVLFPNLVFPITLVRETSRRIAQEAYDKNVAIGIFCQQDPDLAQVSYANLFAEGVLAEVVRIIPLPDDSAIAMVRSHQHIRLIRQNKNPEFPMAIGAEVETVKEAKVRPDNYFHYILNECRELTSKLQEASADAVSIGVHREGEPDANTDYIMEVNLLCVNAPLPISQRYELLTIAGIRKRLEALYSFLLRRKEQRKISEEIEKRAQQAMAERGRTQYLECQLQEIRNELYGDDEEDFDELNRAIEALNIDEATRTLLQKELRKLSKLNPQSPDYQTQYAYLKTITELPWGNATKDNTDFAAAEAELNSTHFGMEKVKERVLEQLAMMFHSPEAHAPILCLVGPPGVGKTSLGESIARAMGRKFQRVSFGGLHDESEIRGHRRTYIGAMPGRIIESIRRAGSSNPIIMLDEIDKIGESYKGDPSAALLEVLDPEQNSKFHDNYIDVDFDLSNVMFITTANTLSTISSPLLDRMEIIELSGYSAEEKRSIALDHLLPSLRRSMQLEADECQIEPATIDTIITDYTAESGVRKLQKQLSSILRKYIRAKVSKKPFPQPVKPEYLHELLGVAPMSRDRYGTGNTPGVVTGLAWTAAGGEILFIECILTPGKEKGVLSLTGNLGDVMKESASISHRYVLAHAADFGIAPERLTCDVHIHVPEGAIPKDGPSAGITMTTAIVSAMTGRPVRENVAMTGEMTLRGKVLPVGGIKEKILAAKRAGIKEIIMCKDNQRNVEEVKAEYIQGLTFHYVTSVDEVINLALA
ncbi:MAG: endopeptidase La [Muribaculaceae bacterium]|nr:endopeptidase La [Muribaculaceae bacterium]